MLIAEGLDCGLQVFAGPETGLHKIFEIMEHFNVQFFVFYLVPCQTCLLCSV
jgi:hypothetical protein